MTESITPQQDHDRRIGRLEGLAEQLDRCLESIERRIDSVERAIAELRASLRWLIGIQFGVVGLLVSILLKLN
jgi:prefoldin subunit 5